LTNLDQEVADDLISDLAARHASDSRAAVARLRNVVERQRETFMTAGTLGGIRRILVVTPVSALARMARLLPPFDGCEPDQILAAQESLLHDSVLERGVRIACLDDLGDGPARHWVWSHAAFSSITSFDCGTLVKRRTGSLACRVVRATRNSASRRLFEHQEKT